MFDRESDGDNVLVLVFVAFARMNRKLHITKSTNTKHRIVLFYLEYLDRENKSIWEENFFFEMPIFLFGDHFFHKLVTFCLGGTTLGNGSNDGFGPTVGASKFTYSIPASSSSSTGTR